MRDRTRELRQGGRGSDDDDSDDADHVALVGPRPPDTDHTLRQARGVRVALGLLEQKLEELEQQQEAELGSPLPPEGLHQHLERLRNEIQELTQDIRGRLKALEPGQEDEEGENRSSVGARVRRTQHGVLSQQLLSLTGRCHESQSRYRSRSLQRLRRQLHIAGGRALSEAELEEMLETGQSHVFTASALGGAQATRAALQELGLRHRELQRLEGALRELGGLFALLGGTVQAQGDVIDRIELSIQESGTRMRKGQQHLAAARRSRQGARKKKLLAAGCVIGTVIVIVIVIVAAVGLG